MGRGFLAVVIAAVVIVLGMMFYPTIHANWAGIDVSDKIPIVQGGMVILSYGFLFFIGYAIYHAVKK